MMFSNREYLGSAWNRLYLVMCCWVVDKSFKFYTTDLGYNPRLPESDYETLSYDPVPDF